MKNYIKIAALMCAAAMLLSLSSCGGKNEADTTAEESIQAASGAVDVEITEKYYVSYVNDIYSANYTNYVGKNVRLEGMFKAEVGTDTNQTYYYVYRVGPGCCGNDGSMCGFEFTYDGDMPKDGDWIRVTGELTSYELNGNTYLSIKASSLEILPESERGAEVVA